MAKILILTPQLPYPPHQGTSLRNFHIIRGLADRHDITLLSVLEAGQSAVPNDIQPLLNLCIIHTVPVPMRTAWKRLWQLVMTLKPDMAHRLYDTRFSEALRQLLVENQFDIVLVEGIELARYMTIVRVVSPGSKIVFDDHNAEMELQRRNFQTDLANPRRWLAAAYSWLQVGRLRRYERWAMEMADGVTAVSETDRQALQQLLGNKYQANIVVIPNCVDVEEYRYQASLVLPEDSQKYDLMFSGKMDYRPNVDAVLWFADEVWPGILAKRPSCTWVIVGQKPHSRLDRLRGVAGITLTGWVESVTPYLVGSDVYIMPFRVGSGTRLKLIESMAVGKAIVSTAVGAEGFPVKSGKEIVLAETALELETAVLQLLDSPQVRQRLGRAAHKFSRQYDWRQVVPEFEYLFTRLMAEPEHSVKQSKQP